MKSIKHYFNHAQQTYDECSALQQTTGKNLIRLLGNFIQHHQCGIDLGCGTGYVTELLLNTIPLQLDAIDFAQDLLLLAKQRLRHQNVNFYLADFDTFQFKKTYDVLFSNMALQWSAHLPLILKRFHAIIHTKGLLAFSMPIKGTLNELQSYYALNSFIKKNQLLALLKNTNFNVLHAHEENLIFKFPNTHAALHSIKDFGGNFVGRRKQKSLLGKAKLLAHPVQQLSYHIAYIIAEKL